MQRVERETTAEIELAEHGETVRKTIRVRYISPTIAELRRDANTDFRYRTEHLIRYVRSFPDIVDDDGKPVEVSLELLEQFSVANILTIDAAVTKAIQGELSARDVFEWMNGKPGKRGPDTYGIMLLAERLGQMPETIENMELYHYNRFMTLIAAEDMREKERARAMKKG